jgi:enoyl-CoA hydratase
MSVTELVRYEANDGIAVVTLDRPPVNAFSTGLWEALSAALQRLGADETIRVGILTARGPKAFSAGADVHELAGLSAASRGERTEFVLAAMRAVAEVPVPLIAAVNGPAIGGALNLVTLCDLRIAATEATFALPEIDRGTVGGGGVFLRRIGVREGVLRELLYSGRRLTAHEALEAGIVDRVVPLTDLMSAALELAAAIARKARPALVLMKRAVIATEAQPDWIAGYRLTSEHSSALAGSAHAEEGIAAFLGKRDTKYGARG